MENTHLVAEPCGSDLILAATTLEEVSADVSLDLAAGMAARLHEAAWRSGLVVIQGGKKLSLAWTAEAVVYREGVDEMLAGLDGRDELMKILQVLGLDLGTDMHHQGSEDDRAVLAVPLVEVVFGEFVIGVVPDVDKSEVLLQELLARSASVELVTDGGSSDMASSGEVVLGRIIFQDTNGCARQNRCDLSSHLPHVAVHDFFAELGDEQEVLIAFEHACEQSDHSQHDCGRAGPVAKIHNMGQVLTVSPATHACGVVCVVEERSV